MLKLWENSQIYHKEEKLLYEYADDYDWKIIRQEYSINRQKRKKEALRCHHCLRRPRPRGNWLAAWLDPTERKGPTTEAIMEFNYTPQTVEGSNRSTEEGLKESTFTFPQDSTLSQACGDELVSPSGHHPRWYVDYYLGFASGHHPRWYVDYYLGFA